MTLTERFKRGELTLGEYVAKMIALGGKDWADDALRSLLGKEEMKEAKRIIHAYKTEEDKKYFRKMFGPNKTRR